MINIIDQTIIFWVQAHIVTPALTPWMILLTKAGGSGAVWIAAGLILLCFKKYRKAGMAVFISLFLTLLIGDEWLKHLVMRSRPCFDYPWVSLAIATPGPHDYSFPSGHTFASFAAAAAMSPSLSVYGRAAVFILAVLIAFSRIYLFVHYPTDVLGGAVLGIACGMAAWYTVKILIERKGWRNNRIRL